MDNSKNNKLVTDLSNSDLSNSDIRQCNFCLKNLYIVTKHPGFGYICELCIVKMRCFQMY